MITSISVSALNPPFVESDLMLPYSGAEDDSRPSSKKFPFAFDSFARLLHQFRPRFGFSEARVAGGKTRLPQLVHALQQSFHHRRTGRLPAPEEHRPYHRRNSQRREQQFNWRQARKAVKIKWRHLICAPSGSLSRNDSVGFGERTRLGCRAGRPARHFGAREYPDRSPTGGGAGRNTRGRVCYPKELNRSGQVSRSNAATIQPSQAVKK